MNDIRSYASLTGNLLARKGGAKPAMRPRPLSQSAMLDDLGWDDMGEVPEGPSEHVPSSIAGLTPAPKPAGAREEAAPVHVQQRALVERFGEAEEPEPKVLPEAVVTALRAPAPKPTRGKRQAIAAGKKAAFTLRLDPDRHLKLRLATAVTAQSAQQLVTAALDQFLESLPEVGSLAEQLPARAGKRS